MGSRKLRSEAVCSDLSAEKEKVSYHFTVKDQRIRVMGGPRAGCSAVAEVTWHEAGPGGSQGEWD